LILDAKEDFVQIDTGGLFGTFHGIAAFIVQGQSTRQRTAWERGRGRSA
jgi:hypothetical protein